MPSTNGHDGHGDPVGERQDRVAVYLRVSSDEQRSRETIKTQSVFLENYVSLYSLEVAGVYSDDGVSGTVPLRERPAGKRLLEDAKAGKFGTVLVYRLDRIGRTLLGVIDAHDRLAGADVALKSATEPMDTATPAGRLIFQMFASFGEYERASIVERSRDGLQRAFKDGKQLGCIPYGYDIDEHGKFVVVEDEAAIIRRIIADVASGGATLYAVIKSLNDEGIPSPGHKYRGRPRKHGGRWGRSTVRGIIHQAAYSGTHVVNAHDGPVERSVPAIVEPELQQKAQAQLAENKRYSGGKPGRKYLLRGLISCEACGGAFVGDPAKSSNGRRYNYYGCWKKKASSEGRAAGCPRVGAEWIEDLVWTDIRGFLEKPGEVLERVRKSLESESEGENLEERRADLTRRLKATQVDKNRLIKAYSQEIIDDEELEVQLVDLRNRIENLKMLISAVEADLAHEVETQQVAASTEAWLMTLRDRLEEIEEDTEGAWQQRREIVTLLVERITVGRDDEGRTTASVT